MAKIIRLGCEVAEVYRQYSGVHKALFGASSLRLVVDTLTGKVRDTYTRHLHTLEDLSDQLSSLEADLRETDLNDHVPRGGDEPQKVLAEYTP